MNPSIKLEIDPHRMTHIPKGDDLRFGGVRVRTTIYVVEQPDIVGATTSTVTTVTIPENTRVELRVTE